MYIIGPNIIPSWFLSFQEKNKKTYSSYLSSCTFDLSFNFSPPLLNMDIIDQLQLCCLSLSLLQFHFVLPKV